MRTFRAWVDREGGNADRSYRLRGTAAPGADWARLHRMVDVETDSFRIVLRLMWRRERPRYAELQVWPTGRRGRRVFRWGRP